METEHARFTDSEGVEYVIESEEGVLSITEHEPIADEIVTVAFFVADLPKVIDAMQAALQHAALTGDYGTREIISGQCVDLSGVELVEERAEQQRAVMQKGLSQIRDGLARHGERCDLVAGTHVIPHVGCILR
ncbi:hypothetical protein SONNY_47 [Arthrobacter phage Sonny]|uniref:Uncharacterized protein n=1 Tax=Arthrobacter phage Sonny TaxID=1772315 RepID=A0A0U4JUF8_9CAUD|nr:hypothetical protein FDH50_gp47 [Arthrobacter phage Sonny]ALY10315.1 hypothetical protein SONNY_47 [Arthrobacter phage Sonny]